jgi:gamma-glutamylcyclotransferase (GGCT)/AIG2-like uncharacterized protein YtfP
MSLRLFAYGTLRQGSAPAEIAEAVRKLQHLGRGIARGHLYDLGAYPGAIFAVRDAGASGAEGYAEIEGEIYEAPDATIWQALDAYEGFEPGDPAASLFVRREIEVRMIESGENALCWAYEYNRPAQIALQHSAPMKHSRQSRLSP